MTPADFLQRDEPRAQWAMGTPGISAFAAGMETETPPGNVTLRHHRCGEDEPDEGHFSNAPWHQSGDQERLGYSCTDDYTCACSNNFLSSFQPQATGVKGGRK